MNTAIIGTLSKALGPKQTPQIPELRSLTQKVVGRVFYGTLLARMRASTLKGNYMHGGRGEDVFGAQLDEVRAERMGQQERRGLADALYRQLAPQQARIRKALGSTLQEGGHA